MEEEGLCISGRGLFLSLETLGGPRAALAAVVAWPATPAVTLTLALVTLTILVLAGRARLAVLANALRVGRETVVAQEAEDGRVRLWVRVLKVQTVAGAGDDIHGDLSVGEPLLSLGRDAVVARGGREAVTAAVGDVALTCDDENGTAECVGHGDLTTDREELTLCDWLAVAGSESQELGWEGSGGEEVGLNAALVASGEVAVGVGVDAGRWSVDEVAAQLEEGQERAVAREASQDDAVGEVGVLGGQEVGVLRTERVADVHDGVELVVDAGDGALAELLGESAEGINLEVGLDFLNRITVAGHANTQTVPGEGGVALVVYSVGDVLYERLENIHCVQRPTEDLQSS